MPGAVVVNQPGVYLVDEDGNVVSAADGTTIADHEGLLVAGKDGTTVRFLRAASDGTLRIDPTGTTTQPISAATLPLPTGAATEAKLEAVRVLLATIDADTSTLAGVDFATETKLEAVRVLLASLDGKDFATETTLTSIKDTDGIKKITDSLPAGTNRIGDVGLDDWLGSTAPTVGQKDMSDSIPVTIASNQTSISVTTGGGAAGEGSIVEFLKNGGSEDMVVNGSSTPRVFEFAADPTDDIQITSLRLVVSVGGSFDFDGDSFGEGPGLSNGVEIDLVANGGTFSELVTSVNINEDFARLLAFQPFADIDAVITATLPFNGNVVLEAGTSDKITVTINDNIRAGVRGIDYFTATIYGVVL